MIRFIGDQMRALVMASPDAARVELREALPTTSSLSTLWLAIDRLGLTPTRRSVHSGAQRRRDVAAARRRWLETQPLHEAGQSVFVDESGATTDWIRRYARSLRGVRIADLARLAATGRRVRWWRRSGPPR